jgi:N-glycosylase/DNA lyase
MSAEKGIRSFLESYDSRKGEIKKALKRFREVGSLPDKDVFAELCFCLCTPQSSAVSCDAAVDRLVVSGLLLSGDEKTIAKNLRGVRFHNNKAKWITEARKLFSGPEGLKLKDRLNRENVPEAREWLVKNIKGLGYKEASHFLRNTGLGQDIAILDRHILKNLKAQGVIDQVPKSLTRKKYMEIEGKMKLFSKKAGIPMEELDLLFWAEETGHVFK